MTGDHYAAIGIRPDASIEQIRAAYVRVMRDHHPDLHPGDLGAEEVSRRANAAWSVLSDPRRRNAYDALRAPIASPPPALDGVSLARATAASAPRPPAYSRDYVDYRAAFHRATVRIGALIFLLGLLLALAFR